MLTPANDVDKLQGVQKEKKPKTPGWQDLRYKMRFKKNSGVGTAFHDKVNKLITAHRT